MNTADQRKTDKAPRVSAENRTHNAELLVVDSHALLKGQRQIVISHAGDQYTLSVTKQGKLILTK